MGTDNAGHKRFSALGRKEQCSKQKNITTTFGTSLFLTQYQMRYVIHMPPTTTDLAIDLMMVAYKNRQNETAVARANNSDLL